MCTLQDFHLMNKLEIIRIQTISNNSLAKYPYMYKELRQAYSSYYEKQIHRFFRLCEQSNNASETALLEMTG